jgi:hypothetical protein
MRDIALSDQKNLAAGQIARNRLNSDLMNLPSGSRYEPDNEVLGDESPVSTWDNGSAIVELSQVPTIWPRALFRH